MALFSVVIEETVASTFCIEAQSAESARDIARKLYRSGILVLEPGEMQGASLCVLEQDGDELTWEDM